MPACLSISCCCSFKIQGNVATRSPVRAGLERLVLIRPWQRCWASRKLCLPYWFRSWSRSQPFSHGPLINLHFSKGHSSASLRSGSAYCLSVNQLTINDLGDPNPLCECEAPLTDIYASAASSRCDTISSLGHLGRLLKICNTLELAHKLNGICNPTVHPSPVSSMDHPSIGRISSKPCGTTVHCRSDPHVHAARYV